MDCRPGIPAKAELYGSKKMQVLHMLSVGPRLRGASAAARFCCVFTRKLA